MDRLAVSKAGVRGAGTLRLDELQLPPDLATYLAGHGLATVGELAAVWRSPTRDDRVRRLSLWCAAAVECLLKSDLDALRKHPITASLVATPWHDVPALGHLGPQCRHLGAGPDATVDQVVDLLLADERRCDESGVRRTCHHAVRAAVERSLVTRMCSHFLRRAAAGEGSTDLPLSQRGLVDYILANCEPRQRRLLEKHYLPAHGRPDATRFCIGGAPGTARALTSLGARLRDRFGALCTIVSEPLWKAFADAGGLLHRSQVEAATGEGDLGCVLLVARTADPWSPLRVWGDDFLTTISMRHVKPLLIAVRHALGTNNSFRTPFDLAARQIADATPLRLPAALTPVFLAKAFGPQVVDGSACFVAQWLPLNRRCAAILEEEARPMTSAEIHASCRRLAERFSLPRPVNEDRVSYTALMRNPDVWDCARHHWIHTSALPVPLQELRRLAELCSAYLSTTGTTVTARHLLDHLATQGELPPALTEELLSEALRRFGTAKAASRGHFRSSDQDRRSPSDTFVAQVGRILREGRRPFTCDELCALLPKERAYGHDLVRGRLCELGDDLLRILGALPHRVGHVDCVGDEAFRRRLVDEALERLPSDGRPTPAAAVCAGLLDDGVWPSPPAEPEAFLWGLLARDPRVDADDGGLVARHQERPGELLDDAIVALVRPQVTLSGRDLTAQLRRWPYGAYTPESLRKHLNRAVRRCLEQGRLWHLPFGASRYARGDATVEMILPSMLAFRRGIVEGCRQRGSIERATPRDLRLLARFLLDQGFRDLAHRAVSRLLPLTDPTDPERAADEALADQIRPLQAP